MNGLLVVPPICGNKKNIGDYIQSVAQEQYWNYIDCYVEREKFASFYSKEKPNLIMNGWFMWNAEQFPTSDSINPFNSLESSAGERFAGLIDLMNSISMDGREITCPDSLKGLLQKEKLSMLTKFFNRNYRRVMAKKFADKTFAYYVNFRIFPLKVAVKLPLQIGWRVKIQHQYKGCVKLDDNVRLSRYMVKIGITSFPMISTKSDYTLIRFAKNGTMSFGNDVLVHNGVSLITSEGGKIVIGSDCVINQRTKIYSQKAVTIGDHCCLGWECQVMDSDCHLVYNDNKKTIGNPIGEVYIGNNVWLASRVSVMKGVTIPSFSIV